MGKSLHLFIGLCSLLIILGVGTMKGQGKGDASASLVLGYCNPEIAGNGIGYDQSGLVATAVYFPEERMQKLAGSKITKVRFGLVKNRMVAVTVFIKDQLTGTPLYQQTTDKKPQKGWNEMTLDLPFTIDGRGIYVGFEYEQTAKSPSFSFTGSDKPGSAYIAFNNEWGDSYGKGYGSLSLQCVVEGDNLPQYDISLSKVETVSYIRVGESFSIENEFGNFGKETIESIDLTYQINENAPVSIHKVVNLPSGVYNTLEIDNLICPDNQISSIIVKIDNLNGHPDENELDNEKTVMVYSYTETYPRTVLIEQFTTERCINCPKGSSLLKAAIDTYPGNVVWVAHHVGVGTDRYTAEESKELLSLYGSGGTFAPAMMIDRTAFAPEPFPVTGIRTSVEDTHLVLKEAKDVPAFVTIDIAAAYDEDTRKLDVEVSGDVLYLAGNDPRLTIYITEDGLYSNTQDGAVDYTHNHVMRAALTGAYGDTFEVNDHRYNVRKEHVIPAAWKSGNLHVVAFINNYDELNISNRKVLNAATVPVMKPTSIRKVSEEELQVIVNGGEIEVRGEYSSFEIYTLQGQAVSNRSLIKGMYLIKINRDAASIVKKVVVG